MPPEPTPFQQASALIRGGTAPELEMLLAEHPELVTDKHPGIDRVQGVHLLEYAVQRDRGDMAAVLVAAGVALSNESGSETLLTEAAGKAGVGMVEWLLAQGAEINRRVEPRGSTPLDAAVTSGRLEMVEFLLDRGADPDILHGNPRRNAVAMARLFGREEIARFLEGRGFAALTIEPELVDVETPEFLAPGEPMASSTWLETKWGRVYEYAIRRGFDALGTKNQILFLVGYLIDQICDGGVEMIYFNPSARYATQMPGALDRIGASRAAEVVRQINALIPGGPSPRIDDLDLDEISESLPPEAKPLAETLEAIFDEWSPETKERVMIDQLYDYYRS